MRRVRIVAWMVAGLLAIPIFGGRLPAAQACRCSATSEAELFANAVAAFEGDAVSVRDPNRVGSPGTVEWTFSVTRVLRGPVTDPQAIRTDKGGGTCGVSFVTGRRYRVLAYRERDGSLWAGLCSGGGEELPRPGTSGDGYWLVAADGGVFAFGGARFYGSGTSLRLAAPVVGMAPTPTGDGYWLVAADGGVFAFGAARFHGSGTSLRLAAPVVGMAPTPTGDGYWLVAADGGVFAFGAARFHGTATVLRLTAPVVAVAATPTGKGYWIAAADGRLFAFGDANFDFPVGKPGRRVVGIAPRGAIGMLTLDAAGTVDGGGDIPRFGGVSRAGASAIAFTPAGRGYWVATADGGIYSFGDARFHGSMAGRGLRAPVVGISS